MRVLASILIAFLVLGGTAMYIRFSESITPVPVDLSETPATGTYSIDITLTFDVASSVFSGFDQYGLRVKLADKILLESDQPIAAGKPVRIENVDGIKVGRNEFWIFAAPAEIEQRGVPDADVFSGFDLNDDPGDASMADENGVITQFAVDRAIRVRIFRDDQLVAEKTLWSSDNQAVQGTIELVVEDDTRHRNHAENEGQE